MKSASLLQDARRFVSALPETRRFVLQAWLGAPLLRASLAFAGLEATLRWVESLPAARGREAARRVGVEEGERLIRGVFRRHFVGGECLPQSLLQYLLHRRDGLPVRFVVGVRRAGDGDAIAAHAWVEDGAPRAGAVAPTFASILVVGDERHAA